MSIETVERRSFIAKVSVLVLSNMVLAGAPASVLADDDTGHADALTIEKPPQPVSLDKAYAEGRGLDLREPWPKEMQVKPIATHLAKTWFSGKELTAQVHEVSDGMLQYSHFPKDEYSCVLKGSAILTSSNGDRNVFEPGDVFVVPKGWSGTWEMTGGFRGVFLTRTPG